MSMSRQAHLDSLRGIAALIVVVVHYLAAFYPYTIFGAQGGYQQHLSLESLVFFPPFGIIVSGHFAICLFFILSGYVLSYSHLGEPNRTHKILASIVKRPIRLGGLVWLSIIIGFLFWHFGLFQNGSVSDLTSSKPWFSNFWAGDLDQSRFFLNLTTASFSKGNVYNPPLWTIKIELYGSMMVYLFLLLLGQSKYRLLISIALVLFFKDSLYQGFWIGLSIADIMKTHDFKNPLKSNNIYYYTLIILFIYFSSYPNHVRQDFLKDTLYSFLPNDNGFGGGYPMLSALFIFILVVSSTRLKGYLDQPIFQFFGKISYGLYVIHLLIIGSLSSWLFLILNSYLGYHASFLIVFFTGMPFIVLMAYMSTKYVDNPSIKLAQYTGNRTIALIELLPQNIRHLRVKKLITRRHTPAK